MGAAFDTTIDIDRYQPGRPTNEITLCATISLCVPELGNINVIVWVSPVVHHI